MEAATTGRAAMVEHDVAGAVGGALVAVEAVSGEEHGAAAPTLPELLRASEVGAMLGVSRQRVH